MKKISLESDEYIKIKDIDHNHIIVCVWKGDCVESITKLSEVSGGYKGQFKWLSIKDSFTYSSFGKESFTTIEEAIKTAIDFCKRYDYYDFFVFDSLQDFGQWLSKFVI